MKKIVFGASAVLALVGSLHAQGTNQLADEKSRVSYAIGLTIGQNLARQGLELNADLTAQAIKDVLTSNTTLLTPAEMQETLASFQKEFMAKQQQRRADLLAKNKAAGDAFLAANKNNPGVVCLPDGLQYLAHTNGAGRVPAAGDAVTVNYRGTLIDGTEFDSSYRRGQPFNFRVGIDRVIPGWTEALQKMPVGSKWKLFIPAELAYGEQGTRNIEPNSVLIFEVELLDAKAPAPPAAPAAAPAPLTSDIIKVPSAEELKKGAKIEVIKADDAAKAQKGAQ